MRKAINVTVLVVFLLVLALDGGAAHAQSAIQFSADTVENDFPASLTFNIVASSTAGEITYAELVYSQQKVLGTTSTIRNPVEFEPASTVELSFTYDTSALTVTPGEPYLYHWEVTDSAGNTAQSEAQVIRYEDTRFDWQVLENDGVAVWWHDRPVAFGQQVFDVASTAYDLQSELFQVVLDFQIRVVIHNNFPEFEAWHGVVTDAVGGEAFTALGMTAIIVEGSASQTSWLNDVIPHEISHLYFAAVTYNPTVSIPVWLDEGVAQYNEFNDHSATLDYVETLGQQGELIGLHALESGFGQFSSEARFRQAYDEALSGVTYMVEAYGQAGVAALLAAYRDGLTTDKAFLSALGVDPDQFELDWAAWLGIPEGQYLIPTERPFPTFRPSPTFGAPSTQGAPTTPEPAPSATPTSAPVAVASPTTDVSGLSNWSIGLIAVICFGALLFGGLVLGFVIWLLTRRAKT